MMCELPGQYPLSPRRTYCDPGSFAGSRAVGYRLKNWSFSPVVVSHSSLQMVKGLLTRFINMATKPNHVRMPVLSLFLILKKRNYLSGFVPE
jgi:hypothetical protein